MGREVAKTLEGIFGKQLVRANALLKRVRRQRTLGQVFDIAKAVVHVFTRSDSTSGVSLPNYRGELGLNFLPPKNRAFNLYGMRVGIRASALPVTTMGSTRTPPSSFPAAVPTSIRERSSRP